MAKITRSALTVLAACGALGLLACAAEAQPLHHLHHAHHAGRYMSTNALQAEPVALMPSRRTWIGGARDDDSANAKNPALPWYSRGRGQETGGPDRMAIGE